MKEDKKRQEIIDRLSKIYDLDKVKNGMIGLVSGDGSFATKMIERIQLKEGYAPEHAKWTHVFISGGGPDEVSATFPRSIRRTLDAYEGREIKFLFHKNSFFRAALRYKFSFFCASECNKPYPVQALFWWFLPNWMRGLSNSLSLKWAKFCSYLADWGFKKVGMDLWPEDHESITMPARFSASGDFEAVDCLK